MGSSFGWSRMDFGPVRTSLNRSEPIIGVAVSLPVKSSPVSTVPSLSRQGSYGQSWMRDAIKARVSHDTARQRPRRELEDYLAAPLEDVENVVAWWGHHSIQYPTIARIAKDYLAIQGSAVASERAFSSGGITGTTRRNCLLPGHSRHFNC
ncbi:hypothetical protein CY34DRAFT_803305 [Suillus luteus UH-Slu-Lm8-n1]|uniref:HAT C-terminal dimerisation domain-containing protein n=1 Tax=Suillus luteus UH-Slu-Lm8-n1 TaxID=930992 RepID=A0A0D0A1Q2_9AGAM|nr:hypothetical protein CY34DRAFT_803305 [Suillus luteus UH-Slu-Lm8-n1]